MIDCLQTFRVSGLCESCGSTVQRAHIVADKLYCSNCCPKHGSTTQRLSFMTDDEVNMSDNSSFVDAFLDDRYRSQAVGVRALSIYIASSWRNDFQPDIVTRLRSHGYMVYDFKGPGDGWGGGDGGPGGFAWSEVDNDWKNWVSDIPSYLNGLAHPRSEEGFLRDMNALRAADVCIMVHPCGVSAAMETGWAVGAGKRVYVYVPGLREPDLMVKMAELVTDDFALILQQLQSANAVNPQSSEIAKRSATTK